MKPPSLRGTVAPSPALIRFLRAQSDTCNPPSLSFLVPAHCCHRHSSTSTARNTRPELARPLEDARFQWLRQSRSFEPRNLGRSPQAQLPTWRSRKPFTTGGYTGFWGLLKHRRVEAAKLRGRDDLPPLASFLEDSSSLGRVPRPTNELKLRCTEFDEHGNVTLVNGEFKKSELIAKYGLLPRDLRKIDSSLLPHILVRPSAILLNLLHLRVLIKHNRVLVFDAYGTTDSYTQSVFMYDLEGKLRQKESTTGQNGNFTLAYEFRALEAVLMSVTLGLESEFEGVSEPVVRVLRELEEDIDRDKLRYLLIYSKKLGTFEQKARLVRDALTELLEADDDLSAMYLSEKAAGKARGENDHTEVEMLLESYHKFADEIVQAAENLVSNIRNTEEIVKAILDANRNSLMLLDLRFSILTVSLGAGTFVAALYGMNLKNFLEESDFGFWSISAWCTVFGLAVAAWGLTRLRRVQRVSMWGEHGSRRPRPWGGQGSNPFLLEPAGRGLGVGGLGPGTAVAGAGLLPAVLEQRAAAAAAKRAEKMKQKWGTDSNGDADVQDGPGGDATPAAWQK